MIPISTDLPICEASQDEFGRIPLSELISDSILTQSKDKHACTIYGIYGAWGEGKTSMMNLVEKRLLGNGDKDNIVIAHFNPWQVGSDELLMSEFFKSICKDSLGEIRDFMKKYGDTIAFASSAVGNIVLPGFGIVVSNGIKSVKQALESCKDTLKEQKDKISKSIRQNGKHLLVFIDDLDRLDKEELHTVFRLIRQVADFDNTIYMVAMDVDMASKSISQFFGEGRVEDGRRFIDKIVQVPIALPTIQKAFLVRYLKQALKDLFDQIKPQNEDVINTIAEKTSGLFDTKRDCIRFINQLVFVMPSLGDEVNITDLCLLEAVKIISQEAYTKVYRLKSQLLKLNNPNDFAHIAIEKTYETLNAEFEKAVSEIIEDITPHKATTIKALLEDDLFSNNSIDTFEIIENKRLQSEVYFDKYFIQAVPEKLIPDTEIDTLDQKILSIDYNQLAEWINEKNKRFGYDEIQRAILSIVRRYDVEKRCLVSSAFCKALSISELSKRYTVVGFPKNKVHVFVAETLIDRYMLLQKETDMGMRLMLNDTVLDETLYVINQEAELPYCMSVLYELNKTAHTFVDKIKLSFGILKDRLIQLPFDEQFRYHRELLYTFFNVWRKVDKTSMFKYLNWAVEKEDFSCERFIKAFIYYQEDDTNVGAFVRLFDEVVPKLAKRVKSDGEMIRVDSSLGLFMANYQAFLEEIHPAEEI